MMSLKQKLANKCVHFTGLMNKSCSAGVDYKTVRDESKTPYGFPCLKTGGQCPKIQFRTEEDLDKMVAEIEEFEAAALGGYAAIKSHYEKTKKPTGAVPCTCGGSLEYAVSSVNGHIWARCKKCQISFNE